MQALSLVLVCVGKWEYCKLQLAGDFEAQVRDVLAEQLLRPEEYAALDRVADDVRNTLSRAWPGKLLHCSSVRAELCKLLFVY